MYLNFISWAKKNKNVLFYIKLKAEKEFELFNCNLGHLIRRSVKEELVG